MSRQYNTNPGSTYPTGAIVKEDGVNFSIFSRHATHVELLLFCDTEQREPYQIIKLDPESNRTFFAWHVFVEGLQAGSCYAWRMDGPHDTYHTGLRFDPDKYLLDPWARAVSDKHWVRQAACQPGENGKTAMRSLVVDNHYDWEGDTLLNVKSETIIIYEMHVGGFTRHPSSGVDHPGTFGAVIEKIPYLQELGITHVELLPVMAFDEQDVPPGTAQLGLKNYWGYSTHSFFSPHPGYCVTPEQGTHIREFRDMVKALHKAGISVIMDVVFNHTSEAGEGGPTINFKGIDNSVFYHLDHHDKNHFRDYTGCGNTVNANHPIVANFIVDCLEYWVHEMHVDGFRFDLASALARGEQGEVLHDPPVLWAIDLSERLSKTKLIAEAWDATGLYQVGSFPGNRWAEWNGLYRDVVRAFIRGDHDVISQFATRISGSSDLYNHQGRLPISSINFITCHDGFTLNDLVSYNAKHNHANGEDNRDGCSNNISYNYGIEGETTDLRIMAIRKQQAKNAFAILLLSQGVPMLLAGDEVLATQHGNNNSYCQDNELTWFDWDLTETNHDMLHFVKNMIALRKRHPALMRRRFLTGKQGEDGAKADIIWHSEKLGALNWDDPTSLILSFTLAATTEYEGDLHVMMNMSAAECNMALPDQPWCLAVDTSLESPRDIIPPQQQNAVRMNSYLVKSRTVAVFEGITS